MEHLHSMQRHDESPEGNTYGSETFLHEKRLGENPIRPLTVLIIFNMRDLANGRKDRNTQKKNEISKNCWSSSSGRNRKVGAHRVGCLDVGVVCPGQLWGPDHPCHVFL